MKNILFFLVAVGVLGLISCKDDDETTYGTLTINVKAVYDGEPLSTFSTYDFDNGEDIQFSLISLMLSDIDLLNQAAGTPISDIALADMSFDNLTAAEKGFTIKSMNIKTGSYTGIRFGIGVKPDINAMKPADFPSTNPLSNTSYYWIPWSSYIFSKTEGLLDTLGTGLFDLPFALHTGSDGLYVELEGGLPIVIESQKDTQLDIIVDYKDLLSSIPIKHNPLNHNPEDLATITALVNNYATSIYLAQ